MASAVKSLHKCWCDRLEVVGFGRSAHDAWKPYPINALRNASLRNASSRGSLVWIVDVDVHPCPDALASLVGTAERAAALRRLCCDEGDVAVVPVIQRRDLGAADAAANAPPLRLRDAKAAIRDGTARPFMAERWPQGHRATGFATWATTDDGESALFVGPLRYEDCFEPYVIVSAALCPRFDEALTGYGRNKALHAYHLHACGARFWATACACLEHTPHALSLDAVAIRSPVADDAHRATAAEPAATDAGRGKRHLRAAKQRYASAVSELSRRCSAHPPAPLGQVDAPAACDATSATAALVCRWSADAPPAAISAARLACAGSTSGVSIGSSGGRSQAATPALTQLCSRWMVFTAPRSVRWPLLTVGAPAAWHARATWLVTHLSYDRLDRLAALLQSWPGCCAASIWVGRSRSAAAAVRAFASRPPPRAEGSQLRLVAVGGPSPRWHASGPCTAYPVNAMRVAALETVPPEALALLVDVDARMPRALGLALAGGCEESETGQTGLGCADEPWAAALRALVVTTCRERGRFLVLPALELADGRGAEATPSSVLAEAIVRAEGAAQAQAALVRAGHDRLRAFHAETCPDGHAPTRTEEWAATVAGRAAAVVDAAEVQYAPLYEPYGIVEARRVRAPGCNFDPRFVGWHRDRAEFFLRLTTCGAIDGFALLRSPAACLLDWWPHEPTAQRSASRDHPLYVAAMEGLYLRCQRALLFKYPPPAAHAGASSPAGAGALALAHSTAARETPAGTAGEALASLGAPVLALRGVRGVESAPGGDDGSVWTTSASWRLSGRCGLENVTRRGVDAAAPEQSPPCDGDVIVELVGGVGPPASARKRGLAVSGVAVRALPGDSDAASGAISLEMTVRFDETFDWGGGGLLPGVYCGAAGPSGLGVGACFRWSEGGALSLKAELHSSLKRWPIRSAVCVNRPAQLVRGRRQRLSLAVLPATGRVSAWCDGDCVYHSGAADSARFGGGASGLDLRLFFLSSPVSGSGARFSVEVRGLRVHGVRGSAACAAAAAQLARSLGAAADDDDADGAAVDCLIASELTVVFAPKEWQSTGPSALAELVAFAPPPRRLVVAIAPPISDVTASRLRRVASDAWPGSATEVHVVEETESYRNGYALRNELATTFAADTKYALRLSACARACATHVAAVCPTSGTCCTSTTTSSRAIGRRGSTGCGPS